ncbi:MAG TPA: DNA polymerase III subunit gamma/tau, partial [Candidatus Saccharimonadales bacterium]|nr:DNA polymerase III subunit gamma/tau [Candidatus Saccharimonadales bacterium]
YLFTGPRGVGKTSIARILAHEINKLPYEDDSAHIDIIEIDAASNRRIDEIRELRDKVYIAPVSAKHKVYIIDEVHMLTKEAFNALLKTLEEPPGHAVFILATTEAHKLPDTIVSRTQRFSFKPVSSAKVASHLGDIAGQEKIKISPDALELLAAHGEGSFRDSISLLDQLGGHQERIGAEDVRRMLGIPPAEAIDDLLSALGGQKDANALVAGLDGLLTGGYQPAGIAAQIGKRLREQLIEGDTVIPQAAALSLLQRLIEVPVSHDPERFLEIVLLDAMPASAAPEPSPSEPPEPPKSAQAKPSGHGGGHASSDSQAERSRETKPKPTGSAPFDEAVWPKVLQTLKQHHNTLYGVVRMAQPSFPDGGTLKLTFAFPFHEKRLREASNRSKLADVVHGLTGKKVQVECALDKSIKPPEALEEDRSQSGPELDAISNIFGAAELLES